jgi:hypothetical protein
MAKLKSNVRAPRRTRFDSEVLSLKNHLLITLQPGDKANAMGIIANTTFSDEVKQVVLDWLETVAYFNR